MTQAQRKPDNDFPQVASEKQPIRENTFIEPFFMSPLFFANSEEEKKWLEETRKEIWEAWNNENTI